MQLLTYFCRKFCAQCFFWKMYIKARFRLKLISLCFCDSLLFISWLNYSVTFSCGQRWITLVVTVMTALFAFDSIQSLRLILWLSTTLLSLRNHTSGPSYRPENRAHIHAVHSSCSFFLFFLPNFIDFTCFALEWSWFSNERSRRHHRNATI